MFYTLYNRFIRFRAIHEGENKFYNKLFRLEFGILVFAEGGKPENAEKALAAKRKPTGNSTHKRAPNRNRTQATLLRGERIPARDPQV